MINLNFFFRKPGKFYSIEELFYNIQKHLPKEINFKNIYLPYHTGILGRIKNIFFAKKNKNEINHITGDVNYIALGLPSKNTILTIHDIGSSLKGNFLKKLFIKIFWYVLPLNRVKYITAISEFSKRELLDNFKIKEDKIKVITNCISDDFFEHYEKTKNNIPKILFIGTRENKNLERTIVALKNLKIILQILGELNSNQLKLLEENNINFKNFKDLTKNEVIELYRNSDLLLFPSLYEGFGLPIIEAQACGIPVITSDLEPMKTVAGTGAILINPYKTEEIRNAVKKIINDKKLAENLVTLGRKNAEKYRCSAVAKQYVNLYKEIVNEQN